VLNDILPACVNRRLLAVSCLRDGSGVSTRLTIPVLCATVALVLLSMGAAFAASYVVPPDDVFIKKADGVIVARALTSYVRETPESAIETITEFTVEESIKGEISTAPPLLVHIPGGVINGRAKVIPGAPRFADGAEYLLFLSKRPGGGFAPTDFALGVFAFAYDDLGRCVAVRDDGEIVGWDVDGKPHQEARRDAGCFLDYVRQVARGGHPAGDYRIDPRPLVGSMRAQSESHRAAPSTVYTATSYTIAIQGGSSGPGARWANFPGAVNWNQGSTQVAAGTTAINTAFSSWNGGGGNVNYRLTSQMANSNGILEPADGVNNIVFEKSLASLGVQPFSCSSGGVLGLGGITSAMSTLNTQNGESFWTTVEGDVSMNQGLGPCVGATPGIPVGDFNSAITHEVGHTLGWRHSDKIRDVSSSTSCTGDPSLECSGSAIMTSLVTFGLNGNLQTWDSHAVQSVYGSGPPPCTPPSITIQPAGSTISSGQSANLSVAATGTAPLNYQWYVGTTGNTSTPVGTNSPTFNTPLLTTTTSYWVRVTGQCSPAADSNTATVTVTGGCTPPSITVQPTGATIASGQSANLSVTATGTATLNYQWYIGSTGNTSTPAGTNSSTFNTGSLTTSTSYWVRVTGQCSPAADSNTVTVLVSVGPPGRRRAVRH
jgi:Ig-like domain CHU_C associated